MGAAPRDLAGELPSDAAASGDQYGSSGELHRESFGVGTDKADRCIITAVVERRKGTTPPAEQNPRRNESRTSLPMSTENVLLLKQWTANWPAKLTQLWWPEDGVGEDVFPPLGPEVRSQRQAAARKAANEVDGWLEPRAGREARIVRTAIRAGLLLWHDLLDESHTEAQSIEGEGVGRLGDCWHAIMHRREPDYGNARYWLRRVGSHPVHEELTRRLQAVRNDLLGLAEGAADGVTWLDRVVGTRWNSDAMVSLCERCAGRPRTDGLVRLAEWIQAAEMTLLMDESLRSA